MLTLKGSLEKRLVKWGWGLVSKQDFFSNMENIEVCFMLIIKNSSYLCNLPCA